MALRRHFVHVYIRNALPAIHSPTYLNLHTCKIFYKEADGVNRIYKIVNPDFKKTKKDKATIMKRIRFENLSLFGPLLKPQAIRRQELGIGIGRLGSKILFPDSSTIAKSITVEKQRGYVDLSEEKEENLDLNPLPSRLLSIKSESISGFPLLHPWRPKGNAKNANQLTSKEQIEEESMEREEQESKIRFPSVTTILNKTMPESSRIALERWKQNMILELGEEGFAIYQKKLFANGKALHQSIQEHLGGKEPEITEANYQYWQSLKLALPKFTDVALLEAPVRHKFLCYHGIVDCVAVYKNTLVVVDWKTSKRMKASLSSLYDSPLQVVAYAGAINFDQRYRYQIDNTAVVLAYENGSPAHIHFMDNALCNKYWKMWLLRLKLFKDLDELCPMSYGGVQT